MSSVLPIRGAIDCEVAVAGGGVVGAALAAILASRGLRVALIERSESTPLKTVLHYDPRVFALTRSSENVLRAVDAWRHIGKEHLGVFRKMSVWDAAGPGAIHFDSAEICEPALGYIVENRVIQEALNKALSVYPSAVWYRPAKVTGLEWRTDRIELRLDDDRRLSARLLVGADGAHSSIRTMAGISTRTKDYQHTALVCTVVTERAHGETARQRFLSSGPLAFLPLGDPHRCSIVWSTSPSHAQSLLAQSEEAFCIALEEAFASALGRVVETGPRTVFPLLRAHADCYVKPRLALVGDAAHRIHPLAGQGANLGLMDAATLAEVVLRASDKGQDIGELLVLRRYERWRRGENLAMITLMGGFKDLFGTGFWPVVWARNVGLILTDKAPLLKHWLIRRAMGLEGDLPHLASVSPSP
jgi:2-octaprenylphenol hydroxylase